MKMGFMSRPFSLSEAGSQGAAGLDLPGGGRRRRFRDCLITVFAKKKFHSFLLVIYFRFGMIMSTMFEKLL